MGRVILALLVIVGALPGCTHLQLRHIASRQGSTLTDLQYKQVLDNIAMFTANPEALPFFALSTSGSAQVTDSGGLSALTFNWPGHSGAGTLNGSRTIVESWGLAPVVASDKLERMRCAYKLVMGNPPSQCEQCATKLRDYYGSEFNLQCRVPSGWFCVGCKKDVPSSAQYVGHFNKIYVWVPPYGADGLTTFTLTILDLATGDPPRPKFHTQKTISIFGVPIVEEESRDLTDSKMRAFTTTTVGPFGETKTVNEQRVEEPSEQRTRTIPLVSPGIQYFPQPK